MDPSIRNNPPSTTIRSERGWTAIDYYHVELDQHAILLAEGLPAESYLDTGNRGFFSNSGEPLVLHPNLTDETDYPTREAGSCAPFVYEEASVRPVRQSLADRAAATGLPVSQRARPRRIPTCDCLPISALSTRSSATAIASFLFCHVAPVRCG